MLITLFKVRSTTCTIVSTDAKAPTPTSPQANVLLIGSTTTISQVAVASPLLPCLAVASPFHKVLLQSTTLVPYVQPPNPQTISNCCLVKGCSHMAVFMAGARTNGFPLLPVYPKSQARTTHDRVSSHKPVATLAKE